jgi:cobalt-zinc-cadmium efflux system outer membrane protein
MAAAAETSLQGPFELTADAAVREALAANRDLQAAIETIAIARGRLLQAGRLENPELEASYADDFAFSAEGERNASVGLAQRFPITSRLAREKDVAARDVTIAEAEVRDFARRLVAEVQSTFYTVRTQAERITVNAELIETVRRVEEATARRLRAAEVSPAEVSLLRIERLRLEQEAQTLTRERAIAAAALTRLLGRATSEEIEPVGVLDPGPLPQVMVPRGGGPTAEERPDLEAARGQVERADADRALARTEVWEDWTVGLGYERDRQVIDAPTPIPIQRDSFLTLGVRLPIPLWNRQQGRIAAAESELRRSRQSRDGLVLRIEEDVRAAEARVRTLRSSVDAYAQEILPEATRAQELFERGYRQGLVGIAELLQAQRQYNESRALHLELLGDLRQAAIALEAARGSGPHLNALPSPGGTP